MDRHVEKLLYSRREASEALSLSVRSIDYLVTTGRLPARRVGSKILIPAGAVRRFAREDHPDSVRSTGLRASGNTKVVAQLSNKVPGRFAPKGEVLDDSVPLKASS